MISMPVRHIQSQVRRRNAETGTYQGEAPFGYKNTRRDGKPWIVPDEHRSKIIRDLFLLYSENVTQKEVTDKILEKYDLYLPAASIQQILTNKFYMGYIVNNNHLYPHNYELVISKELFEKCEKLKEERYIKYAKRKNQENSLFSKCIVCHICKYCLQLEIKNKHKYYRCVTSRKKTGHLVVSITELELMQKLKPFFVLFNIKIVNIRSNALINTFIKFIFKYIAIDENNKLIYEYHDKIDKEMFKKVFGTELKDFTKNKTEPDNAILKLCLEPQIFEDLITKLNIDRNTLSSQLLHLQLDNLIEQDGTGRWVTIYERKMFKHKKCINCTYR